MLEVKIVMFSWTVAYHCCWPRFAPPC